MSLKAVKSIVVATIKLSEQSEEGERKLSFKLMCQIVHGNLGFGRSISVLADAAPRHKMYYRRWRFCVYIVGSQGEAGKKEGGEREEFTREDSLKKFQYHYLCNLLGLGMLIYLI